MVEDKQDSEPGSMPDGTLQTAFFGDDNLNPQNNLHNNLDNYSQIMLDRLNSIPEEVEKETNHLSNSCQD